MAVIAIDDLTTVRLMAQDLLVLTFAGVTDVYQFRYAEEGSSLTLEPITQPDAIQGDRAVALRMTSNWITPYNNFDDLRQTLQVLLTKRVEDVGITFAMQAGQTAAGVMQMDFSTTAIRVRRFRVLPRQDPTSERPRLVLDVRGVVSLDILDVIDETRLYKQIAGW